MSEGISDLEGKLWGRKEFGGDIKSLEGGLQENARRSWSSSNSRLIKDRWGSAKLKQRADR